MVRLRHRRSNRKTVIHRQGHWKEIPWLRGTLRRQFRTPECDRSWLAQSIVSRSNRGRVQSRLVHALREGPNRHGGAQYRSTPPPLQRSFQVGNPRRHSTQTHGRRAQVLPPATWAFSDSDAPSMMWERCAQTGRKKSARANVFGASGNSRTPTQGRCGRSWP